MSSAQEIVFSGVNLQEGDRAKWVVAGATTCDSANDATPFAMVDAGGRTFFTFGATVQQLQLCYKFRYAGSPDASATPYLLFPAVTVAIVRVDHATPPATAIGCSSIVSISGEGFTAAGALTPTCSLGASAGVAVLVNDSIVTCTTPTPTSTGTAALRLDFGGATATHPDVVSSFVVYDASSIALSSIFPAGGGYNLQTTVTLTGAGFESFGAPRCRFGSFEGDAGAVIDSTTLTCGKPRFPDSERTSLGTYTVTVAANDQCYSTMFTSSLGFVTYNTMVESIGLSGAPSTSSIPLTLTGEGFVEPGLPGAVCSFQMSEGGTTTTSQTALTTLSSTSVSCPTPVGIAGTWLVSVLQNGLNAEPKVRCRGCILAATRTVPSPQQCPHPNSALTTTVPSPQQCPQPNSAFNPTVPSLHSDSPHSDSPHSD